MMKYAIVQSNEELRIATRVTSADEWWCSELVVASTGYVICSSDLRGGEYFKDLRGGEYFKALLTFFVVCDCNNWLYCMVL